ncbi:hypothetical protein ACSBOB_22705 [Mesorhizobium sp. ASY16-5R]|uniref:hypothetical protein n=1 Tax=Mesorhizobium sp. ASY16-5R TaxID=3445772 RepID=UPI003FA05F9B
MTASAARLEPKRRYGNAAKLTNIACFSTGDRTAASLFGHGGGVFPIIEQDADSLLRT